MDNKLFLMTGNQAIQMQVKKYEKESYLQEIIRDNPNLLARSAEDGTTKKLYLVKQEFAIQELEDSSNMFSLDHLLVDEEGIPVLVEVKRSTDTRIKREVIGQMLDYASRASMWDIEQIKDSFFDNNPDLTEEPFGEDFWNKVSANLEAGHFRMVFAADEIPDTLRVIIEFMDKSMRDIEVYGVELKPYATDSAMLLSVNIIGNSLLDSQKPSSSVKSAPVQRTPEEFREEFGKRDIPELLDVFDKMYDFAQSLELNWVSGVGAKNPAFLAKMKDGRTVFRIALWKNLLDGNRAIAEFDIQRLNKYLPSEEDKDSFWSRFTDFHNKQQLIESSTLRKLENVLYFNLLILMNDENMNHFQESLKALVDDIRTEGHIK